MTRNDLISTISDKRSFLCVGLDPDPARFPVHLKQGPAAVPQFCEAVIKATSRYCVAFKLNIAFFEGLGHQGWDILYRVREMLPDECFLIADAKRADIGNSAKLYARAFFEELGFDAITVAPYMGEDSVRPFLEHDGKWTILLALTSNPGAKDFQLLQDTNGTPLYERVLTTSKTWGTPNNLMYVTGATQSSYLEHVRTCVPDHFLLVPGVGAQGGTLEEVAHSCLTAEGGILVNSTRDIIYASDGEDFAERAGDRAESYQRVMAEYLDNTLK